MKTDFFNLDIIFFTKFVFSFGFYILIHELFHHLTALILGYPVKCWVYRLGVVGVRVDIDEINIPLRRIKWNWFLILSSPFLSLPILLVISLISFDNGNIEFSIQLFIIMIYSFCYSLYESTVSYVKTIKEIIILKRYDVV